MVPKPVLALGWAGVLPFALLSLASAFAPVATAREALAALVLYGAAILSFMGGAQWGLEMARPEVFGKSRAYGLSVLPALAGFAAALLPARLGLALLIAGFLALLFYDLARARAKIGPEWYPALRKPLTAAVAASLLLALFAGI